MKATGIFFHRINLGALVFLTFTGANLNAADPDPTALDAPPVIVLPDLEAPPQQATRDLGAADVRVPTAVVGGTWVSLGPAPTANAQVNVPPNNEVCGAIQAIAAHPNNANILYIGAVNGGVWRTTNATAASPAWTPVTDTLPSLSIGAIEFDPTDATHQTLVAASGRLSSFGAVGGRRIGVLLTTNSGNNWTLLGTNTFASENLTSVAARSNILMAASDSAWAGGNGNGLFRSTNFGGSFTRVSGGSGLSSGSVSDLVGDPLNLDQFYAAVRTVGIFRSDDAGATWVSVTAGITGISGSTSKIEMAVHNSGATNAVYAAVITNNVLASVWRSEDLGATWTRMDTPRAHNGAQGQIHFSIAADRTNANLVYIGGDRIASSPFTGNLFRGDASLALGSQFTTIMGTNAGNTSPHADSRELVADANGNLIEGDDGGLYRRSSPQSNAGTWSSVIGNLAVIEAHDVAYDSVAKVGMVGTQDNGTHIESLTGSSRWTSISGGDGGDVAIDDQSSPTQSVRYGSSQNLGGFYRKTYNAANALLSTAFPALTVQGGGPAMSKQFTTPIELNKVNPVRLIIGGANAAYESLDRGNTVTALTPISSVNGTFTGKPIAYGGWLAGVPNPDVLFYGSGSTVRVRMTAGDPVRTTPSAFPGGTVQDLVMDSSDWRRLFVIGNSAVYTSANAGTNWSNITGNLTGVGALHTVEFLTFNGVGCVVVGADVGIYCSFVTNLATWSQLGTGLPNAVVYDLSFNTTAGALVAGTMGRGAWLLPIPQIPSNDLSLNLTDAPDPVLVGQPLTYSLAITNLGPILATAVTVTNSLPPSVTFVSAVSSQGSCTYLGGKVVCNMGPLITNDVVTVSIIVVPNSPGTITNVANVGAAEPDSKPANNVASAVTTVNPLPPMIFNVAAIARPTSAIITWDTLTNATSQVEYGFTTNFTYLSALDVTLTTNHAVLLVGLVPNTNYFFRVISLVGTNPVRSAVFSFSTDLNLIVDNPQALFSGNWTLGTSSSDEFGSSFQFTQTSTSPAPSAQATYAPAINVAAKYDVYIWYPAGPNRTTNAQVNIFYDGGSVVRSVNQTINGGAWQLLATEVDFAAGTGGFATIGNNTGESDSVVMADALRWSYSPGQDFPTDGSVPAWWADFYFGTNVDGSLDPDGDGYSTFAEYVVGTDPTNASSYLLIRGERAQPSGLRFIFSPNLAGRVYELQRATNLTNAAWSNLSNLTLSTGTNGEGVFTVTNPPAGPSFYRLGVRLVP
jgi:uncharacterized repeat protein (TIGR01451 family)